MPGIAKLILTDAVSWSTIPKRRHFSKIVKQGSAYDYFLVAVSKGLQMLQIACLLASSMELSSLCRKNPLRVKMRCGTFPFLRVSHYSGFVVVSN